MINDIKRELGISVVRGHGLYLGLPTFSFRSKSLQLSYLRDRIYKRINGWSTKLFSTGAKMS